MQPNPHADDSLLLITAAKGGDGAALDQLMRRHLTDLRVFVRARSGEKLRAKESCSDLVQTVCREVLAAMDGYEWRGEGSFRHWLFTVAHNKIQGKANYYAAARRDPERERPHAAHDGGGVDALCDGYQRVFGPSQYAIANEAVARFESALDRLPDHYREVVLLSRVIGLGNAEIADRLAQEESRVRATLSRALARLATLMRQARDS